jgi:hypothetical protein
MPHPAGTLADGRMTLGMTQPPPAIPFRASLNLVGGRSRALSSGTLQRFEPFGPAAGSVGGDGRWVIATRESRRVRDGGTEQVTSYWSAHRVGG